MNFLVTLDQSGFCYNVVPFSVLLLVNGAMLHIESRQEAGSIDNC